MRDASNHTAINQLAIGESGMIGGPAQNCSESQSESRSEHRSRDRSSEHVAWRLQGFDHAGTCYGFETTRNGDRSRVVVNGKPALELPRAVWDALLDAVAMQRGDLRTRSSDTTDRVVVDSPRVGVAWDEIETEQLKAAWKAGSSITELAELHQRSRGAISTRLKLLGLIELDPIRPTAVVEPLSH